jgi:hypothetical protein
MERREEEAIFRKDEKKSGKYKFELMQYERIIPKIHLIQENGEVYWIDKKGAYYVNELLEENYGEIVKDLVRKYLKTPRLAIHSNGDQIKDKENNEIEWMFSPRY